MSKLIKKQRGVKNKTYLKPLCLIILCFLIVNLMGISLISAADFDNIKGDLIKDETTSRYGKITIKDWFGILDLAELELKKNTDTCGSSCSAETEIIMYQDGILIDDVKFVGYQVTNYQFYIQTGTKETGKIIDDYGEVCFSYENDTKTEYCHVKKVGTHKETEPIWEEYELGTEVIAGTYYIKLEGEKDYYSVTDWQITSQGKLIDDWADWGVGGTITYDGNYVVHTFLTNGSFNITSTNTVEVLVVGGGGSGGGTSYGGGGGAGGLVYNSSYRITSGNYSVVVGTGGSNGNGTISSFDNLIALGGGEGAHSGDATNGSRGGSGGGGGGNDNANVGLATQGVTNSSGEGWGKAGGLGVNIVPNGGGGGGGAGEVGIAGDTGTPKGNGGDGKAYDINGSTVYYAGGGGGGRNSPTPGTGGEGGLGGGGDGSDSYDDNNPTAGIPNSGGGGGGQSAGVGALGGSGIVIIKYLKTHNQSIVTTTLNSPTDYYNTTSFSITFNCSTITNSVGGEILTNISLWLNQTGTWILNETKDVSGTYNTSIFTKNIIYGTTKWTCRAFDNRSVSDWGTNRTIKSASFIENSQTYNPTSTSSKSETFIINFTYDSSLYTSSSGVLNYNGTNYVGTLSGSGTNKLLTASLTTLSSTATTSYNFYWNISLTNSSGINYFTSNTHTQTINTLAMSICNNSGNGIYNVTFINFTIKNAETPTTLVPAEFKVTFNYGIGNKPFNYSYQDTIGDNSSFAFCFLPSSFNYTVDAKIEYEADSYSKNYYYLTNAILTNATQNITLYLLNSSNADLTVLKAQTDTQTPISDVYIQIQRYDTGTDTYYTVGMARTDYAGEDLAYLNWYDTFYKYVLTKNDEIIYIAPSSKISASPVTFTIPSTITFSYDKFLNIIYYLTFNNDTGNFILTYSLPSGGVTSACLRVDKRTIKNDTLICNTCETSSSATIYCNINAYGTGVFIATFYAKGSLGFIESLVSFARVVNVLYEYIGNVDGTMYAILFSALVMVMFFISPVLGIIGMLLGMLGAMALGFQPMNYMEFLGIAIVGVIIIMILKR